jgi:hypothetical protein
VRSRVAAAAAAIALVASVWSVALAQSAVERWTHANRQAIAQLRNPKKRLTEQRAFSRTLGLLQRERTARAIVAAPRDPKQLATSILSNQRLYRFVQPLVRPQKTWWERVLDWLGERWSGIMRILFGRLHVPGRINVAVADVVLAACIVIFVAMFARILLLYGRRSRPASAARPISGPADPSPLVAQSLQAARRGAYAVAVAHLFAAVVVLLHLRARLEEHRSDTVGELRRRIASHDPRLAKPFAQLTAALTKAIYAEHPLEANDWAQSLAAYRQLEALVGDAATA